MKCPNCGVNLDDNARFCSSCGITLDRSERPQSAKSVPKRPLIAALVVIMMLLAVAGLFALFARKGQQAVVQSPAPPPPSSSVVQSPVPPAMPRQPLTQTDVPSPPSMPQAPPQEKAPPEVIQYIEFVKAVEAKRKDMRVDFASALSVVSDSSKAQGAVLKSLLNDGTGQDADDALNKAADLPHRGVATESKYAQDWNALMTQFLRVRAPEPCRPLAAAYGTALGTYVQTMTKLQVTITRGIAQAQDNPGDMAAAMRVASELGAMQNKWMDDIDERLRQSDLQLEQLTRRYGLEKTFTIDPDRKPNTILGF